MANSAKEEKGEDSDVKVEEKEDTPVGQQMMKVGNSTAGRKWGMHRQQWFYFSMSN